VCATQSLRAVYNVQWNVLGQQLSRHGGSPVPGALKWQDVDCSLGVTQVQLSDPLTHKQTSHGFYVVATLGNQPSQYRYLEPFALLGMNFLADKGLRLALDGTGTDLAGDL
jgi:hypothetical protein